MSNNEAQSLPLPNLAPAEPRRRRRTKLNAVTAAERDAPFTDDPALLAQERAAKAAQPDQLPLFIPNAQGSFAGQLGEVGPLATDSNLVVARHWYRESLKAARRPHNTIESYSYDLVKLENVTGPIAIDAITRAHVATFLGQADARSTRKRRLTSLRRFFTFLIEDAKVLDTDPTDGFYPHLIGLKLPIPLYPAEQEALLVAAEDDEPWSATAIWLMMRLGLARSELLALRRDHIELTDPERPQVYIYYDEIAKRGKEREAGRRCRVRPHLCRLPLPEATDRPALPRRVSGHQRHGRPGP